MNGSVDLADASVLRLVPPTRVVLVDDDKVFRKSLHRALTVTGDFFVCAQAGDGFAGLILALEHRPDAVLVRDAMPGLTGAELASRLAANGLEATTRLIGRTTTVADVVADLASAVDPRR